MISDHPESYTWLIIPGGIFFVYYSFSSCNGAGKHIGIIITFLSLYHSYQPFETHAGIHMFRRKRFKRAVFFAVVLDKYIVPYFDHLWMIFVNQFSTRYFGNFFFRSAVNMYFSARPAGACITHLPEIIFFIAKNDPVFRHYFSPFGMRNL